MEWRVRAKMRWLPVLLGASIPGGALAGEHCKLQMLAEVPVSLDGTRPLIDAKINGADVRLLVDSGAFWSMLTTAAAQHHGLELDHTQASWLSIQGLGGNVSPAIAKVKDFTVFNVLLHNVEFLVAGSDPGNGAAGLLGQNILRIADVEYDLAHGMLRFFRTEHCDGVALAYWAKPDETYSVMRIEPASVSEPHIRGEALLAGEKIQVMFDTGAHASLISLRAAKRVGITPDSPGTTPAGEDAGIGREGLQTWIATFPSFRIGEEEIRNARLPHSHFECLLQALQSSFIYDRLIISWINDLPQPELAAEVADFLMRFEEVEWALAVGLYQDKLILSMRSSAASKRAGSAASGSGSAAPLRMLAMRLLATARLGASLMAMKVRTACSLAWKSSGEAGARRRTASNISAVTSPAAKPGAWPSRYQARRRSMRKS